MIVQANRLQGGPRKITSITEVMNMEQDVIIMQDGFPLRLKRLGIDSNARLSPTGSSEATGVRPAFVSRLEAAGIKLPSNMFAGAAAADGQINAGQPSRPACACRSEHQEEFVMTPLIIAALAFISVTAIIGTLMFVFSGSGGASTAERLELLTGKRKKEDANGSILRKTAFEQDKKSLLQMLTPNLPSLQKVFVQADCHIAPSTLAGVGLLLAILAMTAVFMTGCQWYFLPPIGVVMFALPLAWLFNKRRVRLKRFSSQLSDALELVARALRAGHSLAAGMHVVAEEMPAPIAEEFGRVYDEQNLGIAIEDCLKSMCERVPNLDLRFFVTSGVGKCVA